MKRKGSSGIEYLERNVHHDIWIEDGIVIDKSPVEEVEDENAKKTFDIVEKYFNTRGIKKRRFMVILPNVMSISAEAKDTTLRLVKMGVDRFAVVTENSAITKMVINFHLKITEREDLKIKVFGSKEKAKEWLLES